MSLGFQSRSSKIRNKYDVVTGQIPTEKSVASYVELSGAPNVSSQSGNVPIPVSRGDVAMISPVIGKQQMSLSSSRREQVKSNIDVKGPVRGTWNIPKRVKPGRKPATDTPPTKRKAQNRAAQRAFRERKAARIDALEDEKRQIRNDYMHVELQCRDELAQAVQNVRSEFEREISFWKEKADRLEKTLELERCTRSSVLPSKVTKFMAAVTSTVVASVTRSEDEIEYYNEEIDPCARCGDAGRCPCLEKYTASALEENDCIIEKSDVTESTQNSCNDVPLQHNSAESYIPIDFTKYDPTQRSHPLQPTVSIKPDEYCGFCVSDGICICKSEMGRETISSQPQLETSRSDQNDFLNTKSPRNGSGGIVSGSSGPGTCQDCQSNPQQRMICQQLAKRRPIKSIVSQNKFNKIDSNKALMANRDDSAANSPKARESMPCSKFFRLFKEKSIPMDPDRAQWMRNVNIIPTAKQGHFSTRSIGDHSVENAPYEIAAANILATLNKASRESRDL